MSQEERADELRFVLKEFTKIARNNGTGQTRLLLAVCDYLKKNPDFIHVVNGEIVFGDNHR